MDANFSFAAPLMSLYMLSPIAQSLSVGVGVGVCVCVCVRRERQWA
jgi:hypothetical protein